MNKLFTSTKLSDLGLDRAAKIEAAFTTLHATLQDLCGSGRYWALVETKLEEASMFAKKSLTAYEENRKEDKGYIIEYYSNRSGWTRSLNDNHSYAVFSTRAEAQEEADAQTDGFKYRVVEVKG